MSSNLTDISGVGSVTAKLLMEHGLTSPSEIAVASIESFRVIPGISAIRAGTLIKAANELLTVTTENSSTATKAATRPRRTAQKPTPKSKSGNTSTNATKPEEVIEMNKKDQEKLKKAKKAAAKKAAKRAAKKSAAKKAPAKKAAKMAMKKAAAKKAAKKAAAKKTVAKKAAKKAAVNKAAKNAAAKKIAKKVAVKKAAKKVAAKKAKAKKAKSKKSKK